MPTISKQWFSLLLRMLRLISCTKVTLTNTLQANPLSA
jgi:hypothetical protein